MRIYESRSMKKVHCARRSRSWNCRRATLWRSPVGTSVGQGSKDGEFQKPIGCFTNTPVRNTLINLGSTCRHKPRTLEVDQAVPGSFERLDDRSGSPQDPTNRLHLTWCQSPWFEQVLHGENTRNRRRGRRVAGAGLLGDVEPMILEVCNERGVIELEGIGQYVASRRTYPGSRSRHRVGWAFLVTVCAAGSGAEGVNALVATFARGAPTTASAATSTTTANRVSPARRKARNKKESRRKPLEPPLAPETRQPRMQPIRRHA